MNTPSRGSPVFALLRIGFIAGTLDITDNLIFNHFRGITPTMVFRYIASGLVGMDKALSQRALGLRAHD